MASSVCRVCLVDNMTLHSVQKDLQNAYKTIAREKYNKVGYPVHMCYICLTVLQNCKRFMETARDTNIVLKQQQNKMRVARPLFTYSTSKVGVLSTYNGNISLQQEIKMEEVDLGVDEVYLDDLECNIDVNIEKTDADEQTNYRELLVNSSNDSTDTDTVEDNNDTQSEPLFVDREDYKVISQLALTLNANIETRIKLITPHDNEAPPIRKCKTNDTKHQRQAPETSGETLANEITPLNSTPSQSDNIRCRNTKTKPTFGKSYRNREETGKLGKIVKTKAIRCRNKRLARNKKETIKKSNKLALNPPVKNKINTCHYKTTVQQHRTRQITSHTDEKKFSCDICKYKSTQKSHLVRHMKTHTGEKAFTCNICNYKCTQKCNLVSHMKTHTGEKPFTCNTCIYKCIQKVSLVRHMGTHTGEKPFICNTCSYKCKLKGDLVSHIKTHTGEKPFTCNTCDYECIRKSNLVRHMKTHTGETPLAICDYKCRRRHDLKCHVLNKHLNKKRK